MSARCRIRYWLPPIAFMIGIVAVWQAACTLLSVKSYLLPSPAAILSVLTDNTASLIKHSAVTALEATLGFCLANVFAVIVAVGFIEIPWLGRSAYPYIIALKSIPVIAISPLLVIWCGYGMLGKVLMAGIIAFFPLVVNATTGLRAVPTEAIDLMHSMAATRFQILLKLRIPHALPFIFSGLKISSTLAVVGAIVAEMAGAKHGLGFLILMSSYNVDTPMLFAAIVFAAAVGILSFALVSWVELTCSWGPDVTA